jgi:hypothetical protein
MKEIDVNTSRPGKNNDEETVPVEVSVTQDGLQVQVDAFAPDQHPQTVAELIHSQIEPLGLSVSFTLDELTNWVDEARNKQGIIKSQVLVHGVAPLPSADGTIDWADDFFNQGFYVDPETERVDYRQRRGRTSVESGELLATLVRGTKGKDGTDVFGKPIPVDEPQLPKLQAGRNVNVGNDRMTFYAAEDGRVEIINDHLTISDTLVIHGDVGLESGNVDHNGCVQVTRDVLEDSKLISHGDMEIKGIVEPSMITAHGNLYVYGGIYGKEGMKIRVAGEIHARFIVDCDVEAGGDVIVQREIMHSKVRTLGAVRVPTGRIVGGNVMSFDCINVGEAGSDACVATHLIPGVDYLLETSLEEDLEKIEDLKTEQKRILNYLKPVLEHLNTLPKVQKANVKRLLELAKSIANEVDERNLHVDMQRKKSRENATPSIVVQNVLFPELSVNIHGEMESFKQTLVGPFQLERQGEQIKASSI